MPTTRGRRAFGGLSAPSRVILGTVATIAVAAGGMGLSPAISAAAESSSIEVSWYADASPAAQFQPDRLRSSAHFSEFENLKFTVSQTEEITDQAIRISFTGYKAGTVSSTTFGQNSMNYLQAMQCWGPDPLAEDFYETCQWGGKNSENSGIGSSVFFDNVLRGAARDSDPFSPTSVDVPFRTVDGTEVSGKPTLQDLDGDGPRAPVVYYPILNLFNPATTNEVTSARVSSDGDGYFDFETQSADQAPQLGCGTADRLRCWLVIVPRGTVFGGDGAACSGLRDPGNGYRLYTKGRPDSYQGGSPINPGCDYFDNRVVIPLDFTPVGGRCAAGSQEQRVIGSQLMVGAMSSWQPALCSNLKTTYAFSSNTDAVARLQLLEGKAAIAYGGFPLSPGELDSNELRTALSTTTVAYAPVAISGVTIAFYAEFSAGRQTKLVLSPRLVAKLLTQSYPFQIPTTTADPQKNLAHLPAVNRTYGILNQDPEFRELNPTNFQFYSGNPALVLPGPGGADAVRQVWRWIVADADARAFLNGDPDEWGMTVNPYYLPKGDEAATIPSWVTATQEYVDPPFNKNVGVTAIDGSPLKLSEANLDTFPKNDETVVPFNLTIESSRFDTLQFSPYTENILTGARQAFRGNTNAKTIWDPNAINPGSDKPGAWISGGPQMPGARFIIAVSDSPSTERYGLSAASLRLPNSEIAVVPTAESLSAALGALRPTNLDTVKQVDPAQVSGSGYPLTMVTYAAVNLTTSKPSERTAIASLVKQVTTSGQVPGTGAGQLPPGYLPLTSELASQAATAAKAIETYVPPVPRTPSTTSNLAPPSQVAMDDYTPGDASQGGATADDPEIAAGADTLSDARTPASDVNPLSSSGLVIALILGLGGVLVAPLLMRGWGRT